MTDALAALIERYDEKFDIATHDPHCIRSHVATVFITFEDWCQLRDALPVWRPIKTAPLDSRKIAVWDAEKSCIHTIRADDLKQRRVFHWLQSFTHWMPILPPETT